MKEAAVSFDPRVVLRPRSLDETMDLALAYLRTWPADFTRVFAILLVAGLSIVASARFVFELSIGETAALILVVTSFLERIVTVYAGRHLFGHVRGLRMATRRAISRLPILLFGSVLLPLPWLPMLATDFEAPEWIGVGTMLGAFWPAVVASQPYFAEALLLEELPVVRAMRRARVLVLYRFSRGLGLVLFGTMVRVLVAGLAFLSFQFVASFVFQLENVMELAAIWAAAGGYLLAGLYLAVARLFDYVDARTRREGWDIQVRFNAIAQRTRESADRSASGGRA